MWIYFEKLCIVVGWKGLIIDLNLDGFYVLETGFNKVWKLLFDVNKFGLVIVIEFFDMIIG